MSVISLDNRSPEDIFSEHPWFAWYARMHHWDARFNSEKGVQSDRDFILSPECSGRFGIRFEDDSTFCLGILEADRDAFLSLVWSSAALVRNLKGKDYLILSCRDMTENWPGAQLGLGQIQLRVFIGMSQAVADALSGATPFPTRMKMRVMRVGRHKGLAHAAKGDPKAVLPFSKIEIQ